MEARLDYAEVLPDGMKSIYAMDHYSSHCGLEAELLDLIKLRASQINGCGYCVDMHTKDARSGGETEQRLYGLSIWRETPYYTEREQAALALTEAVTLIADSRVPDSVYDDAKRHFSDEEMVKLVHSIVTINSWNRFAIAFEDVPGSYQPEHFATKAHEAEAVSGD
ncbi:MAG: carboxymuconolactone decarboxylase family protein [Nitrolancea sp.]